MIDVWAALLAVTAGAIVGLCSAALYTVLQLPLRVMHACGAPMKRGLAAWALALGIAGGALMGGMRWSLHLPQAFFLAAMLLAGLFTGALAAALSEILDVLPYALDRLRLGRAVTPLLWALALGKAAGAFLGTLFVH